MVTARSLFSKRILTLFTILYLLFTSFAVDASPKLPPEKLPGKAVVDLPSPYNLQAVVIKRSVTLTWAWDPPDPSPLFQTLGYEVYRDNALLKIVPTTTFADFAVAIGSHTYKVRIKGGAKDVGKKIAHYSGWSESVSISMRQTCGGPPVIQLNVEPTRRVYNAIPSLRLHFTGDIQVPETCVLSNAVYHIDSGVSTPRTGTLTLDSKGRFDEFIDAMGEEEEGISGAAQFSIHVTAEDEAGDAASPVYTIDMERENRFAPKPREQR